MLKEIIGVNVIWRLEVVIVVKLVFIAKIVGLEKTSCGQ